MAKKKLRSRSKLYDELKEGLEAAVDYAKGDARPGTRIAIIGVTPTTKRTAEEIRDLRNRFGLTQSVFASILGVTNKAVEAWEAGSKSPSGPVLRMMEILEKEPEVLERVGIYSKKRPA